MAYQMTENTFNTQEAKLSLGQPTVLHLSRLSSKRF